MLPGLLVLRVFKSIEHRLNTNWMTMFATEYATTYWIWNEFPSKEGKKSFELTPDGLHFHSLNLPENSKIWFQKMPFLATFGQ